MSFLKNTLFFILILLGLASGVWAYLRLKEIKRPKESALAHLPANCALYLQSKDLKELNNRLNIRSLIVDRFSELPPFNHFLSALEHLNSLCAEHPELEAQFFENRLHFAYYPRTSSWLICFNLKELGDEREFLEAFGRLEGIEKIKPNLFRFILGNNKVILRLEQGTICCSASENLLEKAFDKNSDKLVQDSIFQKGKEELDNNPLFGVYIDQKLWSANKPGLQPDFLSDEGYDFGQFNLEPSSISINGIHIPEKSKILKALLKQKPAAAECLPYLPVSCSSFSIYNYQNFEALNQELEVGQNCKTFWETCRDSALYAVDPAFYSNFLHSVSEFQFKSPDHSYFVGLSSNVQKTQEQLQIMKDSVLFSGDQIVYRIGNKVQDQRLFYPLSMVNCMFAFSVEEAIYFSESLEGALLLLNELQKPEQGSSSALQKYTREQFPEESNLLVYLSPSQQAESIERFCPSAGKNKTEHFVGIKHACYSLVSGENEFQYRAQLQYENPADESGENLLWGSKLDSSCFMTPFTFVNHQNGETELVVQDQGNTLYLLSGKGKILWKRKLDEAITSPIYQVDAFRNKKFQILFSSRNKIWLIDRLGRDVDDFPVKVPAPITSPLQVFDYENTREYRLFFACSNKRIYNYNIEGKANSKFVSVKTEETVEQLIQYIKVGESDYLLAIDHEGQITAFSRKGELRFRLRNRCLVPAPEFFLDVGKNLQNTKLTYVDEKTSALHRISLTDKKEILKLDMPENAFCSRFSLVDANRNMDLLLCGGGELKCVNLNGSLLFETDAPEQIQKIDHFSNETTSLFYGLNHEQTELWIYDQTRNNKQSLKSTAMPLFTDLFRNKKVYMVYPEGDQLKCQAY